MVVGHLAAALAVKSKAPRAPLGILVAATFGLDLLWPVFLLLGIEQVRIDSSASAFTKLAFVAYPWSHSLLMACVWAALAAAVVQWMQHDRLTALWTGLLVVSHWVLDFVTHRPDLQLWPGGSRLVGLGLWNSVPATVVIEGTMYVAGIILYLRATRASDRWGSIAFCSLIIVTAFMWISSPWSPPAPDAHRLALFGLGIFAWPLWAAWVDRHRMAKFAEAKRSVSPT